MGGPGLIDGEYHDETDNFQVGTSLVFCLTSMTDVDLCILSPTCLRILNAPPQPVKFVVNGIEYYSAENYFQAIKATNKADHEKVRLSGTGGDVWAAGSRIKLRADWEMVKVREMYIGNRAKFEQHPDFVKSLTSTKGPVTFSASTSFWYATYRMKLADKMKPESHRFLPVRVNTHQHQRHSEFHTGN